MQARYYQTAAIEATLKAWEEYLKLLMIMPTGTGKTVVFSMLASRIVADGGRVMILAHRDELIRQAAAKLEASTGLGCAVEKADECAADCMERVIVASVQTLLSAKRRAALPAPTHIIVDECQHTCSDSYLSVLGHWPDAHVLGVTATPDRGDKKDLGKYFEAVSYEYSLPQAIADGFLCPIKAQTIPLKIDLSAVKVQAGDLQAAEVGSALEPYLPHIAREIAAHAGDRKTLIFAPLCATAKTIQDHLAVAGLKAFYCSGEDRSQIKAFEAAGPGSAMVNAMLLTEGYDHPAIDCVVMLRATKVRSLYAQAVGRGTRIHPGKEHLLILDFLWMSDRHSLCRPASLVAEDDEIAQALTRKTEKAQDKAMRLSLEEIEEAKQEVVRDREKALAKKLEEMRHKQRKLVDPLQFAASIGSEELLTYEPALAGEMRPPTKKLLDQLEKAGIFAGDVTSAGHAEKLLAVVQGHRQAGYATPRQIRVLERFGFPEAGKMTYAQANGLITRISANGWRLPEDLAERMRGEKQQARMTFGGAA